MTPFWKKGSEKPTRHGDPDEAVARYLEQLHQADVAGASPPASALNGLGDAYLDKGDVASAVDHYRQAAEVYAREGMHTNAIACLKKVRRHADEEGDVGLLLGRYYAAKKLVPDALAELEAYAERQQRMGYGKRAVEAMKEVVRIVPEDPSRRERLGDLLREEGQEAAALGAYREAMTRYRSESSEAGARRVGERIEELGGEVHGPGEPATPAAPEETARPAESAAPEAPPASATPSPTPDAGEAGPPAPVDEPEPAPVDPAELEEPARPAEREPGGVVDEPGPLDRDLAEEEPAEPEGDGLGLGLEIERTSYVPDVEAGEDDALEIVHDLPEDLPPEPADDEEDRLTIAQQNVGTEEPVERVAIESSAVGEPPAPEPEADAAPAEEAEDEPEEAEDERLDLPDRPDLAAAAEELERAAAEMDGPRAAAEERAEEPAESPPSPEAPGTPSPESPPDGRSPSGSGAPPIVPEPRNHAEMMALAEQHVRTGDSAQAGRYLLLAAEGLREEREWKDAAHAYRRLAEIGEAKREDLEDWVECARQTGRANAVLEALATASRWHLERGDAAAARRSAEEMFLVDPDSEVAADLLERIGGPSSG